MNKPHNPIEDLRAAADEAAAYIGEEGATELLVNEFGVATVAALRPAQLLTAIGLMHDAIDARELEPASANAGETAPMAAATEDPAHDTGH